MPLFAWTAAAAATDFKDETMTGYECADDVHETPDTVFVWLRNARKRLWHSEDKPELIEPAHGLETCGHHDVHQVLEEADCDVKISDWQASMIIFKSSFGIGMLSLPYAFRNAGMVTGILFMLGVAAITNFSTRLLVSAKRALQIQQSTVTSIPDMALLVWGFPGLLLANAIILFCQVGNCIAYNIFLAISTNALLEATHSLYEDQASSQPVTSQYAIIAVLWSFLFAALVQIQNLKTFAPYLFAAQIAQFASVTLIIVYGFVNLTVCHDAEVHLFCKVHAGSRWDTFPIFLGIAVFAVEGIPMVLAIENSMANPQNFDRAFNRAQGGLLTCFLLFGVFGYWLYGHNTKSVITLNVEGGYGLVVKALLCLVISLSYPLQFMPAGEVFKMLSYSSAAARLHSCIPPTMRENLSLEKFHLRFWQACKVSAVLGGAAVSILFPHFGHLLSLLGSVTFSLITFVFPPLLFLRAQADPIPRHTRILCLATVAFGCAVAVLGVWSNFSTMREWLLRIENAPPTPPTPPPPSLHPASHVARPATST